MSERERERESKIREKQRWFNHLRVYVFQLDLIMPVLSFKKKTIEKNYTLSERDDIWLAARRKKSF